MLDHAPFEFCAWTAALVAFATVAVTIGSRRAAARYAVAGSLAALAVAFGLASGGGLIDVSAALAADGSKNDRLTAAPVQPTARTSEEREALVARVLTALAATPGLAEAVRIRLAEYEAPPAAADDLSATN